MILDTDFIIDLMSNEPSASRKLLSMEIEREPLAIATPTLFELFNGVAQSNRGDQETAKISRVIAGMVTFPLDPQSAQKAGQIFCRLYKEGKPIDAIDCMIASIAMLNGEKLLTRNTKHFARISGIEIDTY